MAGITLKPKFKVGDILICEYSLLTITNVKSDLINGILYDLKGGESGMTYPDVTENYLLQIVNAIEPATQEKTIQPLHLPDLSR